MNLLCNITKSEKYFYFSVWILAVLHSLHCFASSSYLYFKDYEDTYNDFINGVYYISNKRDKSDFEWEAIYYLIKQVFPWILLYVAISECIRNLKLSTEVFQLWQVCYTILFLVIQAGHLILFLILLQPAIFFLICNYYRNTVITWSCTGVTLLFITYCKHINSNETWVRYLKVNPQLLYFVILSLFWMNLKCTGYFLEKQTSKKLLDFLSYCLYPPTIFTGPFIPVNDYLDVYKPAVVSFRKRAQKLILNLGGCIFWYTFTNFCLHFMYVNATSYQPNLVKHFDSWSLYGYGYAMGQFFQIKYVVLYGLSTSFASFENIDVPRLPRCIGRIHLYSDMWKYFDPGLYKFLLRYIYVPLCQAYQYRLIASLTCFLFVYLWHGVERYILIWTVLNYVGVVLEQVTGVYYKKYVQQNYVAKMDPYWLRRIKCLIASPLLVMSAISNFYFFAGSDIGNIFTNRIFEVAGEDEILNRWKEYFEELLNGDENDEEESEENNSNIEEDDMAPASNGVLKNTTLLLILYCCCQVSIELQNISARKL